MPPREEIALTCGPPAAPTAEITVPGDVRPVGREDVERDAVAAQRRDGARVEHLGAHAGDLLRLVVVEGAQQPGRGEEGRVGREQAGDVGPDLAPRGAQAGGEVGGGGVRAAAAEEHRLPSRLRAMNPWVITARPGGAPRAAISASSRSKSQVAER